MSSSSAQTPSMIMNTNLFFGENFMRSASVVEIKAGLGQLLATLNVGSQLMPRNPTPFEHQSECKVFASKLSGL